MTPKIAQLVKRVHDQTQAGKIPWEETENDKVFQASFPTYTIRYSVRGDDYVLTIYNDQGSVVERVDDTNFAEDEVGFEPYPTMRETYESARRQALGVEKAIDDILHYLDDA